MAATTVPNPLDPLRRQQQGLGLPVQNQAGVVTGMAPQPVRPVQPPAVGATPGPAAAVPRPVTPQGAVKPIPAPAPPPPPTTPPGPPITPVNPPAAAAPATPASGMYGSAGGTSAEAGSLEDQLRQYITRGLGGQTVSQDFINRAKNQLGSATEGQRAQAVNRINEDAVSRGLFRSGIPSANVAAADRGAASSLAEGIGNILQGAEAQNIQGRTEAANQAAGLLGQNRAWDQYTQQRADSMRGGGGGPSTFTYIDPDTGQQYDIPLDAMGGLF